MGTHFTLVTDNEPISFMYGKKSNKIKNEKILRWRLELSEFCFDTVYRPGSQNQAADALSRCSATHSLEHLRKLHEALFHPGISRFYHFIRSKNLPFSMEDVKSITKNCTDCAETKPRFANPQTENLIKATKPFERISIDFKGPLPSASRNKYILTVIDEYSRFPFAFPCSDLTAATVIKCLTQLFCIFGLASRVHSDRGSAFMSKDVKDFLQSKGVATSRTTPYNPQGNGQVEKLNGTLWQTVKLGLKTRGLPITHWEMVLPQALHAIRSLLCTATNQTPHERLFAYNRKSENGTTLPAWLTTPGSVLMKNNVRHSKFDPLVEEVMLLESNPQYALIRHKDGKESTVSIRQLAPSGNSQMSESEESPIQEPLQPLSPPEQTQPLSPSDSSDTSDPADPPAPSESQEDKMNNSFNCSQENENILNLDSVDLEKHEISVKQGRIRPYNLRNREV